MSRGVIRSLPEQLRDGGYQPKLAAVNEVFQKAINPVDDFRLLYAVGRYVDEFSFVQLEAAAFDGPWSSFEIFGCQ
jgi:hypothetical protein